MHAAFVTLGILAAGAAALLVFERAAPLTAARLGMALERRRAGLRLRVAEAGGFRMPYLEGGRGPALVLVHGFGGDKDNFTRMARFLTPHYRVICPDLPGFGEAGRDPDASYSMTDQAARLRSFLDQVAPGRVQLGGSSMGGFIAAEFAATHPERVASLWLMNPAGTAAAQQSAMVRHYHATGDTPLILRAPGDFRQLLAVATERRPFLPYCVRTALGRRGVADQALHSRIMRQLTNAPLLEQQYRDLRTPALIVWGEQDRILDAAGAATLRRLFRNSSAVIMSGIGHLPMLEAPRRTARDYLVFAASQQ